MSYVFSPQYSSPIEVAKGELSLILCEPDAATLAPHLNLYQYGQALIEFDYWFLGHYHRNCVVDDRFIIQWEQMVELQRE